MPPLNPNISTTEAACATRDEAAAKQTHCRFCDLTGQVTIFHRNYTGLPTMEIVDHNGEVRQVLARMVAHCACEVGRWMRSCSTEVTRRRTPDFRAVGIGGMVNWTPLDPTIDWADDATVLPDWKAFRIWIESQGKRGKRPVAKVYPESNGNRAAAYREMGEAIPGRKPEPELEPVPFEPERPTC